MDDFVCCSYALFYLGDDVLFDSWLDFHEYEFKNQSCSVVLYCWTNLTAIMLVVRGIIQVLDLNVISALITGIASIGHIILGVSLILILLDIKKACIK